MLEPIIWNKRTGNIIGGHQRFKILKNKYAKKIEFLKRELKFYCDNKGIDLKDIFK